tara:strand:- start:348 stop:1196 length:849 start_codon:yes stop_codon:yes gene_type:complete
MSKETIGVVGQGFVGGAIREGMPRQIHVETYDKFVSSKSTCKSLKELCTKAKIVFVCLPTPMTREGNCDASLVYDTVAQISSFDLDNIVIVKSTILPGTCDDLNKTFPNIQAVFNPEFLTEANSVEDFKNQNRIIIGGPRPASTIVKNMYTKAFRNAAIIKTSARTAECIKYFTNCLLATKVSFANEFKQMCDKIDVDYDKVLEYALQDKRIGVTHLSCPGPDGKLGFGGSCFPKDVNAMISFFDNNNIEPTILKAIWNKNLEVRPGKDWEQLKGRAVNYKE